jgi:Photosynthetic reaction centre cytochrome C subunit
MFLPYKKIAVLSGFVLFILIGIIAAKPPDREKAVYKNLRVLSKNISDDDMDFVMETFSVNLGTNCLFCHPGKQNGTEYSFDYVTDVLQNKRVARDMLKMTMKLNKKYFNINLTGLMNIRGRVWCKTCHQGSPVPILPTVK